MKINVANVEKLAAAIVKQEGPRVSARTITPEDVADAIRSIEKRLSGLMLKKEWKGARFVVDANAQTFPNAYKGIPESTQFTVERGASGWFVTDIGRYPCKGPTLRITPVPKTISDAAILSYVKTAQAWS